MGGFFGKRQPQLMAQEWGSNFEFKPPDEGAAAQGPAGYVMRLCGGAAVVAGDRRAGDGVGGSGAAGGGVGVGATPGEVLEIYASGMGGWRPAVEAAAAVGEVEGDAELAALLAAEEAGGGYGGGYRGGGAGGVDEAVEIDSDDERHKGRKVRGWVVLRGGEGGNWTGDRRGRWGGEGQRVEGAWDGMWGVSQLRVWGRGLFGIDCRGFGLGPLLICRLA